MIVSRLSIVEPPWDADIYSVRSSMLIVLSSVVTYTSRMISVLARHQQKSTITNLQARLQTERRPDIIPPERSPVRVMCTQ